MIGRSTIMLVMARADNGVIGRDGALPWHLPADLKHFKALTRGLPMVMGRRTFDSLPGLLPGRRHIVLTRDPAWRAAGAEIARGVTDAVRIADAPLVAVIGGAEIHALFLPHADRIELTEVHADAEGDVRIDPPDLAVWKETAREDHAAEGDRPGHSFVTFRRNLD